LYPFHSGGILSITGFSGSTILIDCPYVKDEKRKERSKEVNI